MLLRKLFFLLITCILWGAGVNPAAADGGALFFSSIVETNDSGSPQVVLEWGALDGTLPPAITGFKLYRSVNGGSHEWLADIDHSLVDTATLNLMLKGDISARTLFLFDNLNHMSLSEGGDAIDRYNAAEYLHGLLDPLSPGYSSLKRMLLCRAHLSAARAQGLAYIDTNVTTTNLYHYILTAVTVDGESQPIGQSGEVDPGQETILPAPDGLEQVRLSECSPLAGGLDDETINIRWSIPAGPQNIGINAVTYGYDLFWSATDLGVVDFRDGIPAELHRVNRQPIIVAGPAPVSGPDSYLAKDTAENHPDSAGDLAWKRNQSFYYYIAAKDIAGHYSKPSSAVELTVEDGMPPRAAWNGHTREIKDSDDNVTPRLALMWDAPTALNFSRYYGTNRKICSASEQEVCWVSSEQSCNADALRCADLDVDMYFIFRFDSPEHAAQWGIDTDGDLWPDNKENDPCDPDLHPAGIFPPELIAAIHPDDSQYYRDITETHRQMIYVDNQQEGVPELNKVYWYRILAVDLQGNQSPLSPPLKGVLYDRSQPQLTGTIAQEVCTYSADFPGDQGGLTPNPDDVFLVRDISQKANSYKLIQFCTYNVNGVTTRLLASGELDESGIAHIKSSNLPLAEGDAKCLLPDCNGSRAVFVKFYDTNGHVVATTPMLELTNSACTYQGCATLSDTCSYQEIDDLHPLIDGSVQVCVSLQAGQSARVYYDTPEAMSAFYTFPPAETDDTFCKLFDDLAGLTSDDMCLGIRLFSWNHVGSMMQHLGCLEFPSLGKQPPPRPLLDAPEAVTNVSGDFFNLHWSMASTGITSYILKVSSDNGSSYQSLWDIQLDDSGRYPYPFPLSAGDLDKEWCFQVRAMATDMQTSDWSNEQCDIWHLGPQDNLPWPPVTEPLETGDMGELGAFYMETTDDHQPVLVLSDDLTNLLAGMADCNAPLSQCTTDTANLPCLREQEVQFESCPACGLIDTSLEESLSSTHFIVYRQENGHDFIQVSPLIEGVHCINSYTSKLQPLDILQDPFVTFMNVDQAVVSGVAEPATIGAGIRVLFKDRYPFKSGSSIRYKVVSIDRNTGEPGQVFTSNWVNTQ